MAIQAAVDGSLAALSDNAFSAAIVAYSLGVVGFAGEYAFGRRGWVARTSAEQKSVLEGRLAVGSSSGDGPGGTDVATTAPAQSRWPSGQRLGFIGLGCAVAGAMLQIISLVLRGVATDRAPWGNMFEFASAAVLVAVVAFLWLVSRAPQLRHLGMFVLIPVVCILVYAGLELYAKAGPLVPALRSYWLVIHVAAAITATGIFMVSAVATALYLVRQRYDRGLVEARKAPRPILALGPRLPAAAELDRMAYRLVAFAFPIWTFAVIAGAIWAESAWGRFWGWDPKETWAFIAWVVYAAYLHARATAGWKGVKAARINLLGFFAMTFNFLIINIVVSGLHSYAGLT